MSGKRASLKRLMGHYTSWLEIFPCVIVEENMSSAGSIWNKNIASFLALELDGHAIDCQAKSRIFMCVKQSSL
jgi:hypothetical protein